MKSDGKKIGIIAMSAKPYHVGHESLIEMASCDCDEVLVFVSLMDRSRKGEITITGNKMESAWEKLIKPSLPKNVEIIYSNTPIREIYSHIGEANETGSLDTFTIFSDPQDIARSYQEKYLVKYFGNLHANGQIILSPVSREKSTAISATEMRRFISTNNFNEFATWCPKNISANEYWEILTAE